MFWCPGGLAGGDMIHAVTNGPCDGARVLLPSEARTQSAASENLSIEKYCALPFPLPEFADLIKPCKDERSSPTPCRLVERHQLCLNLRTSRVHLCHIHLSLSAYRIGLDRGVTHPLPQLRIFTHFPAFPLYKGHRKCAPPRRVRRAWRRRSAVGIAAMPWAYHERRTMEASRAARTMEAKPARWQPPTRPRAPKPRRSVRLRALTRVNIGEVASRGARARDQPRLAHETRCIAASWA